MIWAPIFVINLPVLVEFQRVAIASREPLLGASWDVQWQVFLSVGGYVGLAGLLLIAGAEMQLALSIFAVAYYSRRLMKSWSSMIWSFRSVREVVRDVTWVKRRILISRATSGYVGLLPWTAANLEFANFSILRIQLALLRFVCVTCAYKMSCLISIRPEFMCSQISWNANVELMSMGV